MSLVQPLFEGKIDIVGDVHGELEALKTLVQSIDNDAFVVVMEASELLGRGH